MNFYATKRALISYSQMIILNKLLIRLPLPHTNTIRLLLLNLFEQYLVLFEFH